ncbi:hypothetical protein Pmani_009856 [Petrolisthes manimaculis]|uniref:Uncharacterized protein n=1 Tax=Petrolisthes manimaculis TaxID=1843537 RepID=A0AAE1UCH8_9EUCA|nr:hypothetical protein Pmani_009856 [Petrolisthes manimaculis]
MLWSLSHPTSDLHHHNHSKKIFVDKKIRDVGNPHDERKPQDAELTDSSYYFAPTRVDEKLHHLAFAMYNLDYTVLSY